MTQAINSYNVLIDRFQTFATGHYMINAFTHGILPAIDEPKDKQYPWMHVLCTGIVQQAGQAEYSWTVYFFDLPRDKADAHENKREALSDCIRLAQDLIYEIDNGNVLFGNTVDLLPGAAIVPGIDEWTNTLTGVELTFTMAVPDDYDACAIPADFSVGSGTDTSTPGVSSLSFSESLNNTDGIVTLDNDEESPGNTKYYGTDSNGVKGWYTIPGGGGEWGDITGTLSDQTDLQAALDAKVDENSPISGDTKTKITYDSKGLVTAGADAAIADITGLQTALDGKVDENAAITGATKTKITYDAKGLVTAGADAAIADITGLQSAIDALVPYSGATGDVNIGANRFIGSTLRANGSGGVLIEANNGTDVALMGAGGGAGVTFYDGVIHNAETSSTIAHFDSSKVLKSLATSTYPSLTELSYVKGVTSAIQTQLNAKINSYIDSFGGLAANVGAGGTNYWAVGQNAGNNTQSLRQKAFPVNTTISALYIRTYTSQPGTGSFVWKLYTATLVGGPYTATAVTFTIAAGSAAGLYQDAVNSVAVTAGDFISIEAQNNAAGTSASFTTFGYQVRQ